MISGSVVEVRTEPRGSQLVVDALAGATSLTVEDPTPFDDTGGEILVDDNVYTWIAVTEVDDPTTPGGTNGVLTLTTGLLADVTQDAPVQVWIGTQVHDRVILGVDFGDGRPPVDVYVRADKRAQWSSLEGPVDPPIAVQVANDLSDIIDAPGFSPPLDGAVVWNPYAARRATGVSIPSSGTTWTTLTGWTESVTQGVTAEADGSLTILYPGFYVIDAAPSFSGASTAGNRSAQILINGTRAGYLSIPADANGSTDVPVRCSRVLAPGDNIVMQVNQSSGAALNVIAGPGISPASLFRVSL